MQFLIDCAFQILAVTAVVGFAIGFVGLDQLLRRVDRRKLATNPLPSATPAVHAGTGQATNLKELV